MGTPAHSLPYRADNKLYRIQTPQAPIVQTRTHGEFKMDEYPNGTNAVVGKFIAPFDRRREISVHLHRSHQLILTYFIIISRSELHWF